MKAESWDEKTADERRSGV